MDNLLNKHPVAMSRYIINGREECAVSGEFSLPDYCPDIAVILKCMMTPYIQNRQWSGDQLLVDVMVGVRVLYLDEERLVPRAVEFAVPASCALRTDSRADMPPVSLDLMCKYANCRALGPRRLEVRGAVTVDAKAEAEMQTDMAAAQPNTGLYTRQCTVETTCPIGSAEKILTISETPEFPETLPPAEMLLGGECRAVVKECKLLTGKAIVKGVVYVHQLYVSDLANGDCRCLDFVLPFSQIVDAEGAEEGLPYRVDVQILSDTERCTVGPDGENTVLDVTVKLLVQLQVFRRCQAELLLDAYHTRYPVTTETEDMCVRAHIGCRGENTILPMKVVLPAGQLSHILDVWIQNQECDAQCQNGVATIKGRWFVCMLARDADGQVVYLEHPEEYCLEFASSADKAETSVTVTELHYRVVENCLELQVGVCVRLVEMREEMRRVIRHLQTCNDKPYPLQRAGALVYYARTGESVWDIGARCHTSPECICRENDLAEETIHSPTVLLVPVVS